MARAIPAQAERLSIGGFKVAFDKARSRALCPELSSKTLKVLTLSSTCVGVKGGVRNVRQCHEDFQALSNQQR
jgi:hypothetical protein